MNSNKRTNRAQTALKAIVMAFVCLAMFFVVCAYNRTEGRKIAYNNIAEGNVVYYTTNNYTLYPDNMDDDSMLLVTWYCGHEYAAIVSCDTPRNAQLTVVFDDRGYVSDLQAYCIIDCIFAN